MKNKVMIIGAAIIDVLVSPAEEEVFQTGSYPAETIRMSPGGDALNEATVLAGLGVPVMLETVLGSDMAGETVIRHCRKMGIDIERLHVQEDLDTGINVVLVKKDGERVFLTNPHGSLRSLRLEDIILPFPEAAGILCFASIFVFPHLKTAEMAALFRQAKEQGMLVCADMTKCKNGETVDEIAPALTYVDYLLPNKEEAMLVTRTATVEQAAERFLVAGVKNVIIKCGAAGCYVKNNYQEMWISARKDVVCVDTTGAGDSFAAGFLYGLSRGLSLEECAACANKCGAKAVAVVGATEWINAQRDGFMAV